MTQSPNYGPSTLLSVATKRAVYVYMGLRINILGVLVLCCCITIYPQPQQLRTTHLYCLRVSVGQESGHNPTGSFVLGPSPRL